MWELAANWHWKKTNNHKRNKKKQNTNTHTQNICQATAKNVYFGIIYNGLGGGTSREGRTGWGGGEESLITFLGTSLCK